jgi:PAS domain S-box-containing protein
MIIIKISEGLKAKLNELGFRYSVISDIKKLPDIPGNQKDIVLVGSKAAANYDFFVLKTLFEKNIQFIIEVTRDTDKLLKKQISDFEPKAFINSAMDKVELDVLLNNFVGFDITRMGEDTFLARVIDQLPTPIFIKNTQGKYIACNRAFCEFSGYDRQEIIGRSTSILTTNKKAHIYDELDKKVMQTGEECSNESKIILKNQTVHTVLVSRSPLLGPNNEIIGVLGLVTDISRQKQREQELKIKKQKASESDKLKTSFLSNMSHEIRTPMNAIVGFSQLMGTPNLSEEKKVLYIDQINHNAAQLLKLIEDIIEVSKIEAGKIQMSPGVTPVNDILEELQTTFEAHRARMGKNHVELRLKEGLESSKAVIESDPYRLKQILTNLLGNAFKFTEEGNVTFGYKLIKPGRKRKYLEFFVQDTGLGINREKLAYVFDRFSKIPAGKTKLYGGTGLGLSISKNLTELLGGKMTVESEENVGTKFIFTIPYHVPADYRSDRQVFEKAAKQSKEYFWNNKTVFIAEDEEMNYLYLNEILKDKGLKIVWFKDGLEFLDKVKHQKPDLVLMDIKMPKVDGYEATRKFKEMYPEVPVIIQTAYAMKHERKKGFDSGGDQYLEKPVNREVLLAEIERFLS